MWGAGGGVARQRSQAANRVAFHCASWSSGWQCHDNEQRQSPLYPLCTAPYQDKSSWGLSRSNCNLLLHVRSPGQRPRGRAQAHRLMLHHLQRQAKLSRNRLWPGPTGDGDGAGEGVASCSAPSIHAIHHRLSIEMMLFATPTSNSYRPHTSHIRQNGGHMRSCGKEGIF